MLSNLSGFPVQRSIDYRGFVIMPDDIRSFNTGNLLGYVPYYDQAAVSYDDEVARIKEARRLTEIKIRQLNTKRTFSILFLPGAAIRYNNLINSEKRKLSELNQAFAGIATYDNQKQIAAEIKAVTNAIEEGRPETILTAEQQIRIAKSNQILKDAQSGNVSKNPIAAFIVPAAGLAAIGFFL
jgi:hypothetical protein